ncbi:MAG TPA: nuclear transport factor 2 family protein [Pseudonocardiaceae bacterium]
MSDTAVELATLRTELKDLTDRAEITRLCDRYTHNLDLNRDNDAWLDSVFTEDAYLIFPMGEYRGMDGLKQFQDMARKTFETTHHISSNYDINLAGDRAEVTAHLQAIHVHRTDDPETHFGIGGHYTAETVRTEDGWRIRKFNFTLVWRA